MNFLNIYIYIPSLETKFQVQIIKTLGESSGITYLTSDNRILKITSSEGKIKISKNLLKKPNKHFPKIFS